MAVRPYRTKAGETRWEYVVELPRGRDGRRRQEHRRGYPDKAAADRLAALLAGRTEPDETPENTPPVTAAVTTTPRKRSV